MKKIVENIAELINLKSIITLALNAGLLLLLSGAWNPSREILAIYSGTYSAVMTYYFCREKFSK